jgi:predicted ester cyclase
MLAAERGALPSGRRGRSKIRVGREQGPHAPVLRRMVHLGNLDVVDEIIAPDCPLYFGGMFMGTGPEAFKQTRTMMFSGFPDFRWTIEEIIAEGETVAERLTGRGTHQGEFMNVSPTGSRVELSAVAMAHIREGQIVEMRGMVNMLGLLQQIGAVPAPGRSEEASPT